MGCFYSRLDREAMISRCKARRRYMKQLVKARHAFSAAHFLYLRSLWNTGSALLSLASAENTLHAPVAFSSPPLPPSTPDARSTETSSSSVCPKPPPPQNLSTWDFWDPFSPNSVRPVEEAWNETAPVSVPEAAVEAGQPGNNELASKKGRDVVEIIRELDDNFVKAANAGTPLSLLLEVPNRQKSSNYAFGKNSGLLMWTWSPGSVKWNAFGKFCEDPCPTDVNCLAADGNATHCSTIEKLYTWEKKLYQEVKNAENLKLEHEKKAVILKNLEMKGADSIKIEKAKKEVEKLESYVMVALQTIEATSSEIIKLREFELYPQLLRLVTALMNMWKSMHEIYQVQMHAVQQLKNLNCIPSTEATSEIHRQSTLQLELEAQQWLLSFTDLIKAQRDYIQSLTGWLRLSLFQVGNNPVNKTKQDSAIYTFCEKWQRAINNAPDNVASEGMKGFLSLIHAIVVQQAEEQKQKRKAESVFKEFEKKAGELRSLENKHSTSLTSETASSETNKDLMLQDRRAKVETLRAKASDEKSKYEKSINMTRSMTINNLQMGLPNVFQAMTGFAEVYAQSFESVHNLAKSSDDLKLMLP